MASRALRRRTSPADEVEGYEVIPAAELDSEEQAAEIVAKGKLLEYLDALSPEECAQRCVYIYRLPGPQVPARIRVARELPLPVDANGYCDLENYIQKTYGGGDFKVHIKIVGFGKRKDDHNGIIRREGPPIFPAPPPPTLNGATGQVVAVPTGQGGDVANRLLDELTARRNPIAEVAETIKAMKGIEELSSPAPADQIGQLKSLADLLRSLTPAQPATAAAVDPMAQGLAFVRAVKEFSKEVTPAAPVAAAEKPAGLVSTELLIRLIDAGRSDIATNLLHGAPEDPGLAGMAAQYGLKLLEHRPDAPAALFDGIMSLIRKFTTGVASAAPAVHLGDAGGGVPATSPDVQQSTQAAAGVVIPPAAAASAAVAGGPPQPVIDDILGIIARAFAGGKDGTTVAVSLDTFYPALIPDLAGLFQNFDDATALQYLRAQPAIAGVMQDPRFPVFYGELKDTVLSIFEGDDEHDDEDESGGVQVPDAAAASVAARRVDLSPAAERLPVAR